MISIHILIAMLLILGAVLVPLVYFKKTKHISLLVFLLGGVGFYLSSQVLENILHRIVLQPQADGTIALRMENPWLYVLYTVAAAAIFEETGRWVIFYWLQKKRPLTFGDGVAYGLGHGAIEALFVGIVSLLNLWVIAQVVTQGNAQMLAQIPQAVIDNVRSMSAGSIYLLALERILAILIQILLTFWVWKAVKEKVPVYFLAALGLHALIDLAPSLAQVGFLPPLAVEALLLVQVVALVFLTKKILKVYLKERSNHGDQSNA